jgi:hypothetical protein
MPVPVSVRVPVSVQVLEWRGLQRAPQPQGVPAPVRALGWSGLVQALRRPAPQVLRWLSPGRG